ncbi:MAG: DUF3301 domain-containing protein [Gammaproteobacteria bacterium]|nr:DUF3301 domain-containing protein [Gammaproteobacteria bacterium]NVK89487.1 DUF3301 domain-containing protein [Gammaproteobacteria bacterium]
MSKLLTLLIVAWLLYFWWRGQRIKERAYQAVLKRCYELDVELLDSNIALLKQGFKRDTNGRLYWQHKFQFEFTSTREHRYRGVITMAGFHVLDIDLEAFHIN